jgi:hypothetical protein
MSKRPLITNHEILITKSDSYRLQNYLFQFKCLASYWVYSVYSVTVDEVDQLEFEWQDYDRFKGAFRVDPQGVYKVKFPVTEAGKIREPTTMDLTQFPTVETLPPQGRSPLMNWWLRNGPR